MVFSLLNITDSLIQKQAASEILKCNDITSGFGLILSPSEALELAETRVLALKKNGRLEFGGGVIEKIIRAFCDSPYICGHNYAETLHDLLEIFYYYKNETLDLLSDDDLIRTMKFCFDGICQGSLDLLAGRELERMAHNLRYGYPADYCLEQAGAPESPGEED